MHFGIAMHLKCILGADSFKMRIINALRNALQCISREMHYSRGGFIASNAFKMHSEFFFCSFVRSDTFVPKYSHRAMLCRREKKRKTKSRREKRIHKRFCNAFKMHCNAFYFFSRVQSDRAEVPWIWPR